MPSDSLLEPVPAWVPAPPTGTPHPPAGRLLVLAGFLACAAGALALALPAGEIRLVLLIAFVLVGPGAAIVCHVPLRSCVIAAALACTASLTTIGLITTLMLWLDLWQPFAVHLGFLVGCLSSLTVRATRRGDVPGVHAVPRTVDALPRDAPTAMTRVTSPTLRWLPAVGLIAAAGLWVASLLEIDPAAVGYYGLTLSMGWPFITALVLICAVALLELCTAARTSVLILTVVAFLVTTRGTAPLLLDYPEYSWTYKHFGVVDLINQFGRVTDPSDIYQQWPAFFTSAAHVSALAGIDPIRYGAWSPLFFVAIDAFLLGAVCRTLTGNRRVIGLAIFIFAGAAWPESNYFSPQAFAFALALGFYLIMFLWLRAGIPALPDRRRGLVRLRRALLRGMTPVPSSDQPLSWTAVAAACCVFFVITAAHQLSPYLMLAPLVSASMLGLLRPRLLVPLLGAIAVGFAIPRLGAVTGEYSIINGFDLFANASGNATGGWATDGQIFSAIAARGTAFGLWGATMVAAFLSRRRLGSMVLPLILAFAPFALMLVTNYGGEIVYRVYVFSIPTCALILAATWFGLVPRASVQSLLTSTFLLSVLCLASLQGVQGQFALDRVPRSEVIAAQYLYAQATPGSAILLGSRNFPSRLGANYGSFNPGHPNEAALLDEPQFRRTDFTAAAVPAVTDWARTFPGSQRYLVLSDQMSRQIHYFGLPDGSFEGLESALRASPDWTIFYDSDGTTIFRLVR